MVAIIALVVGLALLTVVIFLWPVLVMAALAGLMLGLLVRAFTGLLKRLRRARVASLSWTDITITGFIAVALLAIMMAVPRWATFQKIRPEPIYVHVPYSAVATLVLDRGEWEIKDQSSISKSEFKLSIGSNLPAARVIQLDSLFGRFVNLLEQEEWQTAGLVDGRVRLIRSRRANAPSRWFPARTVGPISLNLGVLSEDDIRIRLVPEENAKLNLRVPKYTVASTYPPATQRVDMLQDDWEHITVSVGSSLNDDEDLEVRVAILSPLLRWPFGSTVAKYTPATALQWIIVCLFSVIFWVFAKEVEKAVLTPIAKRVLKLLGVKYD